MKIVQVPAIKNPITPSPGFEKKDLANFKLDILGCCGFGCRYCSSNTGNYLRINRKKFAAMAQAQQGEVLTPTNNPELTIVWPDVLEKLEAQLAHKPKSYGAGKVLVFSMLTDGFSPVLVKNGTTRKALELICDKTSFRIRVLTKCSIVGSLTWIQFFAAHPGRFVVGLSTGTTDDDWAFKIEIGTSIPSARLRALRNLQDSSIPTYGMLCPVFPDMLEGARLEALVQEVRPDRVEHVWAEPYNDRMNWRAVRDGYEPGSAGYTWLTEVYEGGDKAKWSKYATDLYLRLRAMAERDGWLPKLRYLLYEGDITEADAKRIPDLQGVLLQSKPDSNGLSKNPFIRAIQ